jgi:hypothetical protein
MEEIAMDNAEREKIYVLSGTALLMLLSMAAVPTILAFGPQEVQVAVGFTCSLVVLALNVTLLSSAGTTPGVILTGRILLCVGLLLIVAACILGVAAMTR